MARSALAETLKSGVREISNTIKERVRDRTQQIIDEAERRLYRFERRLMRGIFALALIISGLIYLSIAAVFLIERFYPNSFDISFLIVGAVLLILGLIVKAMKGGVKNGD